MNELVIDSFAGGGGASTGIEWALGRSPDIAINHSPEAIAMHALNHPNTRHFCENVWKVDPLEATGGHPVGLAWFSPDCTHFSKAKGGKPRSQRIRGLAWVVHRWAKTVRPRVICLENVEEFADWGPLLEDGRPCPVRRGLTFRRWWRQLENLGYEVDARELRACDYGAPTTRKRLFIIARCDGQPIVWPPDTHGPGLTPYRAASECIDWSLACPSIFGRKKPLAEATLRRIARGLMRYVVNARQPFLVLTLRGTDESHIRSSAQPVSEPVRTISAGGNHHALVGATLINTRNGERAGQAPRVNDIRQPYPTVTAQGSQGALVVAFLARHYGGHENDGSALDAPMHTITARDHHAIVTTKLEPAHEGDRCCTEDGELEATGDQAKRRDLEIGNPKQQRQDNSYRTQASRSKDKVGVSSDKGGMGRTSVFGAGASGHLDVSEGTNPKRPDDKSSERLEAGQSPRESRNGQPGRQQQACLQNWPEKAADCADRSEPIFRSEASPDGGTILLCDSLQTWGLADDGFQSRATQVAAFLTVYYGTDQNPSLDGPLPTITSRDRFGLVMVHGERYRIADIGMRMLQPAELYRAQGFPEGVKLLGSKESQVELCGNSVSPPVAAAIVRANMIQQAQEEAA